jgi:hypothetical protein
MQAPFLIINLITVHVSTAKPPALIPNIQFDKTLFRISYFWTFFIAKLKKMEETCNKSFGILYSSGLETEFLFPLLLRDGELE